MFFFDYIILAILTIVPLMVTVAFFTLAERKIMGLVQKRQGPMVVGW
jgi:NADH:ubiquinone oxidoreductase subunit H